jgi:WXG100 family type VII secretion target
MAMIRMDVDQAQATIDTMRRTMEELNSQLAMLGGSVDSLLGAWEGSAQVQFSNAWQEWRTRFSTSVNELQPMINGLVTERQQIIDADSSSTFA